MGDYVSGVFLVGTVTVGASGSKTIYPALSNGPFKNLSITVRPIDVSAAKYTASVYLDDELVEEHSYPDSGRIVCHMSYPNKIFPPNMSLKTLPGLRPQATTAFPLSIKLKIANLGATAVDFQVYSTFEEYNSPRAGTLKIDDIDSAALS